MRAASTDPDTGSAYRFGLDASNRGDSKAFEILNGALERAIASGDVRSAALASAVLLITGQNWGSFRRFPEHIARLEIARDSHFPWHDRNEELLGLTGLLVGLLYFGHDDPFLALCVERIMALLESGLDVNIRFAAGRAVMYYSEPRELRVLGQRVYSLLQPDIEHEDLTPHRLANWLLVWERCSRYAKKTQQADLAHQQTKALAERHNLRDILFWLAWHDVELSLPSRNVVLAEHGLAVAEAVLDPARLAQVKVVEFIKTRIARMKGQGDRAVFHASCCSKYSVELGDPPVLQAISIVNEAQARLLIDDFETACKLMRQAAAMVPALFADEVRDMISLTEAYEATILGKSEGPALLAAAWAPIRERQFYETFDGYPEFGAKLRALTLEHGIEVEFVSRQIEVHAIAPPVNAPEAWPWPIRIYALGGFSVQRNGQALLFEGKAQKKPIELLKALIALGGRGVAKQKLYDLLWPDAEPEAAGASLDSTVSRLRKLLGDADSIRIEEGKVGFDPARVWLDVWAFDRDVEALQSAMRAETNATVVDDIGQRLLARYRGPFLGSEEPQRWSLVARDRWQNRFRRSLADAGRYWEQRAVWSTAITLYERALEEDSLAENLYRRLMRAHIARGEPAEAARVYRRCRDMLSVQLGIPPSPDTEELFRSIYGN
jgi:LuxR family transcriptional regulator, maltose regulon positive regulatory protein